MFKITIAFWKMATIILFVSTLILYLIIIWPERNKFHYSNVKDVISTLQLLGGEQKWIKGNHLIDKNNNGTSEYSDSIENMEYVYSRTALHYVGNHYVRHYSFFVKVGESIDEREKSFEIYAIPKTLRSYDDYGDGAILFAIDETRIIRYKYYDGGDKDGVCPPIETMKKWSTIDEYYKGVGFKTDKYGIGLR
jgi:hypothetical protein